MVNRPDKLENVLEKIKECIMQKKYTFTKHALQRVKERGIDISTTRYILLTGHEDKKKSFFDKADNCWKYAIVGITKDKLRVRVIVAFDEEGMLVITVMYVG
jgi:Domain of unknown function (DUF4258)